MTTVFVPGVPAPQGSAKAYPVKTKTGKVRAVVTHDNENTMPWRAQVAAFVRLATGPRIAHPSGAVHVEAYFVMPRRAAEPKRVTPPHTRKPDGDKLLRAVLDAMTGLAFTDDAQVTSYIVKKRTAGIGEQPGVRLLWKGTIE